MGAKKSSIKGKGCYATYKATGRYEKNRKRDLERHLKQFPNDECAKAALKNISYRRYTPHATGGWINRKDPTFHGVPANSAKFLAQIKRIVRKVSNELQTHRPYQDLLKKVAIETQNKAQTSEKRPQHASKKQKPVGKKSK